MENIFQSPLENQKVGMLDSQPTQTNKMKVIMVVIVSLVLVGFSGYFLGLKDGTRNNSGSNNSQNLFPEDGENAEGSCIMDAMECPDGSYVGRTGPDCEFVCPNENVSIECPTDPNGSYARQISKEGTSCLFTMIDTSNETDFSIIYPPKWKASIVGASASNLRFEKNTDEIVYVLQSLTDLPLESVDKAQTCYEGCLPIIGSEEKEISKTVKTYGSKRVLEVVTSLNNEQVQRYFYLSNQKTNNESRLFVFQFSPTTDNVMRAAPLLMIVSRA